MLHHPFVLTKVGVGVVAVVGGHRMVHNFHMPTKVGVWVVVVVWGYRILHYPLVPTKVGVVGGETRVFRNAKA